MNNKDIKKIIYDVINLQKEIKEKQKELDEKKEIIKNELERGKYETEYGDIKIYTITDYKLKKDVDKEKIMEQFPQYIEKKISKDFFNDLEAEPYIEINKKPAVRIDIKDIF